MMIIGNVTMLESQNFDANHNVMVYAIIAGMGLEKLLCRQLLRVNGCVHVCV